MQNSNEQNTLYDNRYNNEMCIIRIRVINYIVIKSN